LTKKKRLRRNRHKGWGGSPGDVEREPLFGGVFETPAVEKNERGDRPKEKRSREETQHRRADTDRKRQSGIPR